MNLAVTLRRIDYSALDISDYSRNYIKLLLPILDYYLDICNRALDLLSPSILVDYGGGHGFMSLLAKERGIPNVIYIDHNPEAAKTVSTLSSLIGFGPDTILTGDQETLLRWCQEHRCTPDALVGIDVIEHIYRLEPFFATLHTLNPQMSMAFSTASTPFNPFVKKRLKRFMLTDEYGNGDRKGYLQLRREHIASQHPGFSEEELDRWAAATRGLTFDDITAALQTPANRPHPTTKHPNTCDPATGNWTERILSLGEYRQIVSPRHITLHKGFYDSHKKGLKGFVTRSLNLLIHLPCTRPLAPFIILEIK